MDRSPDSLSSKWHVLEREWKIYLAARARIDRNKPSGMTDQNVTDLIMDLYREIAGKKDKNGRVQNAPPFTHILAAEYLVRQNS